MPISGEGSLQEQLKVTKNYALDVTRVLKEVDILQSETEAKIALISATAQREANVIVNQAEADALKLEQSTNIFRDVRGELQLDSCCSKARGIPETRPRDTCGTLVVNALFNRNEELVQQLWRLHCFGIGR